MLQTSATISVDLGPPCTRDRGCTGTDACVMGVCVPGPSANGGLGTQCDGAANCADSLCASAGSGQLMYCTEPCDPSVKAACPHGFSCLSTTSGAGVCWASGGCCDAGASGKSSALVAVVLVLVLRRRR
jgi:hypothetical protein